MTDEHEYIALPKLYGAPAYARPATGAETTSRPFDPDDLPLESQRTELDQQLVEEFAAPSAVGTAATGERLTPDAGGTNGLDRGLPFFRRLPGRKG